MNVTGLGRVAFNAYREAVEGVTYDGQIIPQWDNLTDEVRAGWEAAADAVVDFQERDRGGDTFT